MTTSDFNAAYANEYVIPSGFFLDDTPISPDILMYYQKKLMKELEERLWNVDHFLEYRFLDYWPAPYPVPKFVILATS